MGYYRNDSPISLGKARVIALGEKVVYLEVAHRGTICVPQDAVCYRKFMRIIPDWEEVFVKTWFLDIIKTTFLGQDKINEANQNKC
jgi:hypothetical protein